MSDAELGGALERLWTPHRMAYIAGSGGDEASDADAGSNGSDGNGGVGGEICPLCQIPARADGGLVLARGASMYAVLNLHPYNPGHLMVLPYRHVAELETLTKEESVELTEMTQDALRAIKAASSPEGFNVGFNLGSVAGGSLSAHLHQHVVPRWTGDVNIVTVLSRTKVMPQLLEETRDLLVAHWPGR